MRSIGPRKMGGGRSPGFECGLGPGMGREKAGAPWFEHSLGPGMGRAEGRLSKRGLWPRSRMSKRGLGAGTGRAEGEG